MPYVDTVALERLPMFRPVVRFDGPDRKLDVWLAYGTIFRGLTIYPLVDGDGNLYCPEVPTGTRATVDGQSMVLAYQGGWTCEGTGGPACVAATLSYDVPADVAPADAQVTITDSGREWVIPIGDVLVPRAATPVGSPDWHFTQGQSVTIAWSSTFDLSLPDAQVGFQGSGNVAFTAGPAPGETPLLLGTDTLTFVVPQVAPSSGTMTIELEGCTGALCVSQTVQHAATIGP